MRVAGYCTESILPPCRTELLQIQACETLQPDTRNFKAGLCNFELWCIHMWGRASTLTTGGGAR